MASPSSVHQQLQEAQQANAALKMNDTIQLTSVGEFQAAGYKLDSHCLYSVVQVVVIFHPSLDNARETIQQQHKSNKTAVLL